MNTSGYEPTEFNVLVRKQEVAKKIGNIYLPDNAQEKEKYAMMDAELVAVSHLAFTYADEGEWQGKKPKPGDRVLITKYGGVNIKGKDGQEYTLVKDKDVLAFVSEAS